MLRFRNAFSILPRLSSVTLLVFLLFSLVSGSLYPPTPVVVYSASSDPIYVFSTVTINACASFSLSDDHSLATHPLVYYYNMENAQDLTTSGAPDSYNSHPSHSYWTFQCHFSFQFITPGWKEVHVYVSDQYSAQATSRDSSLSTPSLFNTSWATLSGHAASEATLAFYVEPAKDCYEFRVGLFPADWSSSTPVWQYWHDQLAFTPNSTGTIFVQVTSARTTDLRMMGSSQNALIRGLTHELHTLGEVPILSISNTSVPAPFASLGTPTYNELAGAWLISFRASATVGAGTLIVSSRGVGSNGCGAATREIPYSIARWLEDWGTLDEASTTQTIRSLNFLPNRVHVRYHPCSMDAQIAFWEMIEWSPPSTLEALRNSPPAPPTLSNYLGGLVALTETLFTAQPPIFRSSHPFDTRWANLLRPDLLAASGAVNSAGLVVERGSICYGLPATRCAGLQVWNVVVAENVLMVLNSGGLVIADRAAKNTSRRV
ncbi:hypothetical protein PAPYR_9021 [Paratrimastix pyriformis]|uniref:Uncharacterized protein n=1 Tax=Paratrimastix pyriformis TaxID=342808 RepID=A0ABQ8U9E3_9EUKA|nr:hypothetical protein PAPYR_9021 [Paratrimastix pyriformis]